MKSYSRYIEDENFLHWVFNPSEESNQYWNAYLSKNPQEKEVIRFLKGFLLALKTKDTNLTETDKQEILLQIERRLGTAKKPVKLYGVLKKSLKYAAMLAILATVSIYFLKKSNGERPIFENLEEASLDTVSETQLILGSGEQVVLGNEKSTVVYSNSGTVIINQKDTLNRLMQKKLKVETFNQLIVPYGKRSKITLSDGSTVHLNSGTKLTFPEEFIGAERKVYLDGEAFFEVATNNARPFVVKPMNSIMDIKAIGTKFNVSAYSSDQQTMTVLIEGEVYIAKTGDDLPDDEKTVMRPGELASWDKENESVEVKEVHTYPYISWMEGILQFESESLANIAKKLERYYNVRIDFEDSLDNQIRISGKLDLNREIAKTFENIVATAAINYEKINDKNYRMGK